MGLRKELQVAVDLVGRHGSESARSRETGRRVDPGVRGGGDDMSDQNGHQLLHHYDRASKWALSRVAGADGKLDTPTPLRRLGPAHPAEPHARHAAVLRRLCARRGGRPAGVGPARRPRRRRSGRRVRRAVRDDALQTFGEPGRHRDGPARRWASPSPTSSCTAGTWPRRRARTRRMPEGLRRGGVRDDPRPVHRTSSGRASSGPRCPVGADATPQERLLAYTGRQPA